MTPSSRTPQQRDRRFARVRRVTQAILLGRRVVGALVGYAASVAHSAATTPIDDVHRRHRATTTNHDPRRPHYGDDSSADDSPPSGVDRTTTPTTTCTDDDYTTRPRRRSRPRRSVHDAVRHDGLLLGHDELRDLGPHGSLTTEHEADGRRRRTTVALVGRRLTRRAIVSRSDSESRDSTSSHGETVVDQSDARARARRGAARRGGDRRPRATRRCCPRCSPSATTATTTNSPTTCRRRARAPVPSSDSAPIHLDRDAHTVTLATRPANSTSARARRRSSWTSSPTTSPVRRRRRRTRRRRRRARRGPQGPWAIGGERLALHHGSRTRITLRQRRHRDVVDDDANVARGERMVNHIIDPRTGSCANGSYATASVSASDCVLANAFATAALLWDEDAAYHIAQAGWSARLVRRDGALSSSVAGPRKR